MSEGLLYFLLGTALSIPSGIASILLAGPVQRQLDARAIRVSGKRKARVLAEYEEVKRYREDQADLVLHVLIQLTPAIAFCGLAVVYAGLTALGVAVVERFPESSRIAANVIYTWFLFSWTVFAVIAAIAGNRAMTATILMIRVHDFEQYEQRVHSLLGVERETVVETAESGTPVASSGGTESAMTGVQDRG